MALLVVLLWVFRDDVIGDWASGHEGAREVFDQGGREALERAGYAPPSFLPVAVTMPVVGAMLVSVLAAVQRLGWLWGQLGLGELVGGLGAVGGRGPQRRRPPGLTSPQAFPDPWRDVGMPVYRSGVRTHVRSSGPGAGDLDPRSHRGRITGVDRGCEAKGAGMRRYDDPVETRMGLVSG